MSNFDTLDLSKLSMDELKTLLIKIQLILELKTQFKFVPIQAQGDNA